MTLIIPYEHCPITINPSFNGDLAIELSNASALTDCLFNQFLNALSYDDLIRLITPQSFEQIVEHYNTEYDKE